MKTFSEKERCCEATFLNSGPFWHACTPGIETPMLFSQEEDFVLAMNVIAQATALFPDLGIISFEVMDNHFHFVICGQEHRIQEFWAFIRRRLSRYFPAVGTVEIKTIPVDNLRSLRNNIAYTNRNGYVVSPDHTPFSYPWGTGRYYFLDWPEGTGLSEITIDRRRLMFRSRTPDLPGEWKVAGGYVLPCSFCSIKFGMAMFRDAHHYFNAVTKNVEAYAEVATELDDAECLTDTEAFNRIWNILGTQFGVSRINELSKAQKLDLARSMHYDMHSSNEQIRRVLDISAYEINSMFPLSKKP